MKKISPLLICSVLAILFTNCGESLNEDDTPINEVKIGDQVWMTKNLNVDKFRNGDPIPEAKTNEDWEQAGKSKQPAWCYYDNDTVNGEKYGKLYNWYAVNDSRGLAPNGWHIPSDDEWAKLIDYLGGKDVAGLKMKNTSGWVKEGDGTNESGFSCLPGGFRFVDGYFDYIEHNGCWWSSTQKDNEGAWTRHLVYSNNIMTKNFFDKSGLSVRCLRD